MITFSIWLEASDPVRNIRRAYQLAVGQDLFGTWMVETTYGRVGTKGRTQVVMVQDEAEACRVVERCLKRRASAPKRIGVPYVVKGVTGALSADWRQIWPECLAH
ncbi:WGR domain-containing protein [Methylocaldum sp. BRCS4]|jgi:predicted DNA-binding WGR domain protein|uniref:WGR domain-containing protein n=1 Tax=unclassified Methylocaldum TaxID=2622260 RepID=UPI000A31EEB6|nr:WGR domain-containing protein [Methylocaldum sp. BRCS4]